ncbi:MAG TPA: hypothetical protein VFB17_02640 [Gaiellaceae bacterium]|nr:hypothetical protein [Gaiellaceae bacterium]
MHAVVALPSDTPDTFAENANQVADDVTSMVGLTSAAWARATSAPDPPTRSCFRRAARRSRCKGARAVCLPATDYALTVKARFPKLPAKRKQQQHLH